MDPYYGIDRSRYQTTTAEQEKMLAEETAMREQQEQQARVQADLDAGKSVSLENQPYESPEIQNPTGLDGMPTNPEQPSGLRTQAEIDKENMTADEYGPGQVLLEWRDAIAAGGLEGVEDILTAPERYQDMMAGEDVGSTDYKPEWNPLAEVERPVLKTWWGPVIKDISRGATIASTLFLGARAGGSKFAMGTTKGGGIVRGLGYAGVEAAIDRDSQGDSIVTTLTTQVPGLKNIPLDQAVSIPFPGGRINTFAPTYTYNNDHPLLKTFKNVVEQMGLTGVAEFAVAKFTGNADAAADATRSVDAQRIEKGRVEFKEDFSPEEAAQARQIFDAADDPVKFDDLSREVQGDIIQRLKTDKLIEPTVGGTGTFRGHKNKPLADDWQGSPMSADNALDISKQVNIKRALGLEEGSTGSWTTPLQAERMANEADVLPEEIKAFSKDLLGDERYQRILQENPKLSLKEIWGDAKDMYDDVFGREGLDDMSTEEFFATFNNRARDWDGDTKVWRAEDVIAADLINAQLFSQMRDTGIAMRELADIADLEDIDGPLKTLYDRFVTGMYNARRARRIYGQELATFKTMDPNAVKKTIDEISKEEYARAKFAADFMVDLIRQDSSDDTIKAFAEFFSQSNKIDNIKDLNAYLLNRLTDTGMLNDSQGMGILFRELGSVQVNSMLSGPKTPMSALTGTSTNAFLRPAQTAIGALPGALAGSQAQARALRGSLASLNAMREAIPESLKVFQTKLGAYWSGDIATIDNRFAHITKNQLEWERTKWMIENNPKASVGDKTAFAIANTARTLNNSNWLTYGTKIMSAIDDGFRVIMARARAREFAMKKAMGDANVTDMKSTLKQYEDEFYATLLDAEGNIDINKDTVLKAAYEEATLTEDLSGFGASLEAVMNKFPITAPFFRFARTGINGLNLSYKQLPLLGVVHRQSIDIIRASADDLSLVAKYGIKDADQLASAKALLAGRQAFGTAVTFTLSQMYMNGMITGDGPSDPGTRAVWESAGWKPRQIKLFGAEFSYDRFEPFTMLISSIANVGDNMKLMGEDWAEQNFATIAFAVGVGAVSKSYTQGFADLLKLSDPQSGFRNAPRILGNLMNYQVPLGSLRNEVGKILTPYMREVNATIGDTIRNRNKLTEFIAADPLPAKHSMLNGKLIGDWNIWQRGFNAISPVQISVDEDTPGTQLLFNSGYNYAIRGYRYGGYDMQDDPGVRSAFQLGIGTARVQVDGKIFESPQAALDYAATLPVVRNSMATMQNDIDNGRRELNPMTDYAHNNIINNIFDQATASAWAKVQQTEEGQALIAEQDQKALEARQKYQSTQQVPATQNPVQLGNY